MNIYLFIFILWYGLGFISHLWPIYLDWKKGTNITVGDLVCVICLSVCGPILLMVDGEMVIIKGKKSERN